MAQARTTEGLIASLISPVRATNSNPSNRRLVRDKQEGPGSARQVLHPGDSENVRAAYQRNQRRGTCTQRLMDRPSIVRVLQGSRCAATDAYFDKQWGLLSLRLSAEQFSFVC